MFMRVKIFKNDTELSTEESLINLLFGEPILPKLSDQYQEGWCVLHLLITFAFIIN